MDQLSLEALQSLADTDPKSLDIALLDPLKQQLEAMGDEPSEERDALKAAVDMLVQQQITRLNGLAMELTDDWGKAVKAKRQVEA